jgi:hypothetical protein
MYENGNRLTVAAVVTGHCHLLQDFRRWPDLLMLLVELSKITEWNYRE